MHQGEVVAIRYSVVQCLYDSLFEAILGMKENGERILDVVSEVEWKTEDSGYVSH